MSPRRRSHVLLAIVGVLLLTNPLWLFPHEGDARYTYERSEVVVRNGTLVYEGFDLRGATDEENSLNPVACQPVDDDRPRACAFDHHLADHSAVTVPRALWNLDDPRAEFARVEDRYYRRIQEINRTGEEQTVTYDVERVPPRTVLAASARNVSGRDTGEGLRLEVRVAVTGDTVTSFEELEERDLGNVYRLEDSYYTVVRTDRTVVDHGLGFLRYDVPRYLIAAGGIALVAGVLVNRIGE